MYSIKKRINGFVQRCGKGLFEKDNDFEVMKSEGGILFWRDILVCE